MVYSIKYYASEKFQVCGLLRLVELLLVERIG